MTDDNHCRCIALNHPLHQPGACDEPPSIRGGVCQTCRYWSRDHADEETE